MLQNKDIKTKINEEEFYKIQDVAFKSGVFWHGEGKHKRKYDGFNFLYFRNKTKSLQYGIYQENFEADIAKEVSPDEFINKLRGNKNV